MVVAYVPVNLTNRIKDNMQAKIYVNDELNFDAHVMMTGVRSEDIPENLRSYFAKANKALIALLNIDEGQIIPFWSATSGLPVKVKIRNLFPWEDEPEVHRTMLYEVGKGLILRDEDAVSSSADVIVPVDNSNSFDSSASDKSRSASDAPKAKEAKESPKAKETPKTQEAKESPKAKETPKAKDSKPTKHAADADTPKYQRYMSVLGVFSTSDRAQRFIEEIKKDGVNGNLIQFGQKWFVYYSSAESAAKAYAETAKLRKSNPEKFEGIWILDTHKYDKKK